MTTRTRTIVPMALVALSLACSLPITPAPTTEAPPETLPPIASPTNTPAPTPLHGDWPVYADTVCGFEVRYPPEGVLDIGSAGVARIDLPFAPGTNLQEKYLEITCTPGLSPCVSEHAAGYAPGTLPTETRVVGETEFSIQGAGEGAMGSFYDWVAYSTTSGDRCASLTFILHSTNPALYSTPPVEFDPVLETAIYEEIVATFGWAGP